MKKSKFITGLSAAFVATMALMSCSSLIRGKDGVVLTVDGVEYTAQDLFEDQKTPAAAEAKFNAVYKVAVRAYFRKNTGDEEEIKKNTQIKISEQKATAQSNADKNGTSYNEEWQKILDSNGVEDEQGLYNKFEYELQKEKFENRFYDNHYADLRSGKNFPDLPDVEFTNYLEGKQPYHIKHILVKLASAKAGDGVNVEISADEARKLGSLIENLARGDSFESLASTDYNDDETARKNSGSLGIMSRDTSFVNDFKLGIYMYESFYGSSTQNPGGTYEAKAAKTELGLNETVEGTAGDFANKISTLEDPSTKDPSTANNMGIGQIPYEAAEKLFDYADYDFGNSKDAEKVKQRFSSAGLSSSDVGAKYYPRNVIFNKYFNKHNVMVITPRKLHDYTTGDKKITDWTTDGKVRNGNYDQYLGTFNSGYASLEGFKRSSKNDDKLLKALPQEGTQQTEDVLRDENGRVILVFHSGTGDSSSNDAYQGIHFVVIERSPFIGKEFDSEDQKSKDTSLDEYYTEYYPGQSGGKHPTYSDGTDKRTFVNYFPYLESKDLKARADTIKDELKKCDSNLSTYLYQNLVKTGEIKFNPKMKEEYKIDIEKDINDWIAISRVTNKREQKRTWNDTWQDYYFSLESQVEQRKEYPEIVEGEEGEEVVRIYSKLIPEACFYSFVSDDFNTNTLGLKQLFGEGGIFHD